MPRKRTCCITENLRTLTTLERRYREQGHLVQRVRMLRLLKQNPSTTLTEVSEELGCSERSVHRWLKEYQQHGIERLLGGAFEEHRMRIKQHELEELRSKLRSGDVGTLNEVQQWLRDEFGVEYSLKAISNLLQHRLKARRVWVIP